MKIRNPRNLSARSFLAVSIPSMPFIWISRNRISICPLYSSSSSPQENNCMVISLFFLWKKSETKTFIWLDISISSSQIAMWINVPPPCHHQNSYFIITCSKYQNNQIAVKCVVDAVKCYDILISLCNKYITFFLLVNRKREF